MKIPKQVKVMGIPYDIIISKDIANSSRNLGETHLSKGKIFLDPELPKNQMEQTFLHELLHACYWQVGLNEFKEVSEEQFVNSMSNVLYITLKENKIAFHL